MSKGYYGLSFPFRVGVKGGLAMSGTNHLDSSHIVESINQILNTRVRERVMSDVGCNLSTFIFETTDESSLSLLRYEIHQTLLAYEPRISLSESDITITTEEIEGLECVVATINYQINDYTNTTHTTSINLGGASNEN